MRGKTKTTVVVAMWWSGVVIATLALLAPILRQGKVDLSLRSPFDNTKSGHAEQWIFLDEAAAYVPDGSSFTVVAPDRETEMNLFMMAVGLLPHASPLPTSYYGQPTSVGTEARFVLEFEDATSGRPPRDHAIKITGGWVRQRLAAEP